MLANTFPDCFFFPFCLTSECISLGTVSLPDLLLFASVSSLGCSPRHFSLLVSEAQGAEPCPDAPAGFSVKSEDRAVQLSDTHSKTGSLEKENQTKNSLASDVASS